MLGKLIATLGILNLPADLGFVFIPILNPYGVSYGIRYGHLGEDPNRSCFPGDPPENTGYGSLLSLVEPEELNWEIMKKIEDFASTPAGWVEIKKKVICGQYHRETGLFYGIKGLCYSGAIVRDLCLDPVLHNVKKLCAIDVHTGIGPYGVGTILSALPSKRSEPALRALKWFKEVHFPNAKDADDAEDHKVSGKVEGDLLSAITRWLPDAEVTAVALEQGTTSPRVSFPAKVGKKWLSNHPDKVTSLDPKLVEKIYEDHRLTFAPIENASWMEGFYERFFQVFKMAVAGLSE